MMPVLEKQSRLLNEAFGYRTRIIGRDELHADYVNDQEAAGAMHEPDGIGIHAGKLAFGYLELARKLGAKRAHRQPGHRLADQGRRPPPARRRAARCAPAPSASPPPATPRPACTTSPGTG